MGSVINFMVSSIKWHFISSIAALKGENIKSNFYKFPSTFFSAFLHPGRLISFMFNLISCFMNRDYVVRWKIPVKWFELDYKNCLLIIIHLISRSQFSCCWNLQWRFSLVANKSFHCLISHKHKHIVAYLV